jgi:Dolichyl-phosphate-mannose-protein mannosyltransferase
MEKMLFDTEARPDKNDRNSGLYIMVAILTCVLQLCWFASKFFNQIDFDGMAYTGIARHVRQGEFYSSINAFRSPLISWLIAALALVRTDYLYLGKIVSIGSFLFCLPLLYFFTLQLWHSKMVASLAVLLLALGRGLMPIAVGMVTPDFLFAALVLIYFIVLFRCLHAQGLKNWFYLGVIHGLAFLAKAFALPWLAVCTVVAVLLSGQSLKTKAARLGLAALIPLIVAAGWATVLHSKYGVYTTGSQFKTNLFLWTLHQHPQPRERTYALLEDTTKELDEYLVDDPMPPGSRSWSYHVSIKQAFPKLLFAEKRNLPKALKELTIVVTPGVVLAFMITLALLTRKRSLYPVEWQLSAIVALSFLTLVTAYSMLVFDGRYLFPLVPLILAIGARFLIADPTLNHAVWRRISVGMVVLGACVSVVYRSSPFLVLTRDFQIVSYRAGRFLRDRPGQSTIVSLGSGPFPEHGVGWEAGYQAAYFSGGKLIACMESLPTSTELSTVMKDLRKASPDAIVVWGSPSDGEYAALTGTLVLQYPSSPAKKIVDPVLGESGIALFTAP